MKRDRSMTSDIAPISSKKTRRNDALSPMENLVTELQMGIFVRVAARSCKDIISCKLSCKTFKQVAEDDYIYQHVSLDKFPIVSWTPQPQTQQIFLDKCLQCENMELVYRQAVIDYFGKGELQSECLHRAANSGHHGALYLSCITYLFKGDEESKEKGIKLLGSMIQSSYGRKKVRDCRRKLKDHMSMIWVRNLVRTRRPVCCTVAEDNHRKKMKWDLEEYEDSITCEACIADLEVKYICGEVY